MSYAVLAQGKDDRQLEELDIAIGMTEDPYEDALAALRAHQRAAGIAFDDPDAPVAAPDDDGLPPWMTTDEEFR